MQWDQPASFYVLRTLAAEDVPEGVTTGDRQWMRINVVPANNIYFEDDFSDIGYTGNWSVDGTTAGSTENPEGAAGDADGIHGWEENLKDVAMSFVVCGLMSMVIQWHHNGYRQTVQQMVQIALRLMSNPLAVDL